MIDYTDVTRKAAADDHDQNQRISRLFLNAVIDSIQPSTDS